MRFTGTLISCLVISQPTPMPELQTWRTHFAGLKGTSELRGLAGGRVLDFEVLVLGEFETRDRLRDYIDKTLNGSLHGKHGELRYTSAAGSERWNAVWKHCTLEGFAASSRMLPDVGGTLDGGWHVRGTLRFVQLSPE